MTIEEIENGLYWARQDMKFFTKKAQEAKSLGIVSLTKKYQRCVVRAEHRLKDLSSEMFVRRELKGQGYAWEY